MAQKGFDILGEATDSRYRLSMVVGRRAAQLKQGVPSTLTSKPITREDNAVTVAMRELELGSGVRWDNELPSAADIGSQVQRDRQEAGEAPRAYSILRDEPHHRGDDHAF